MILEGTSQFHMIMKRSFHQSCMPRYRSLLGGRKRTLYDENYDYEEGFRNSADKKELTLAVLDAQIRKVINSLKKNGLYENSIILVTTDNGGGGQSSNRPLRGHKETLYE